MVVGPADTVPDVRAPSPLDFVDGEIIVIPKIKNLFSLPVRPHPTFESVAGRIRGPARTAKHTVEEAGCFQTFDG